MLLLIVALVAVGAAVHGPRVLEAVRAAAQPVVEDPVLPPPRVLPPPPGTAKRTVVFEVPADEPSASVMLVVVAGPDGAEVHGKYTIDGRTVREGKASGPYGVLTITDS